MTKQNEYENEYDEKISESTKKKIMDLPEHAQYIFKKAHPSAVKEYHDPNKRKANRSK